MYSGEVLRAAAMTTSLAKEVTSHRNVKPPAGAGEMTLSFTAPLLL